MSALASSFKDAAADRSYWLLQLAFFTCGFHVCYFLVDPPARRGGCVGCRRRSAPIRWRSSDWRTWSAKPPGAGWSAPGLRLKHLLFWIYLGRAAAILIFMMAPKTATTFYVFALGLGVTWLATLPPTAGIIGKLFGTRYLATLIGFAAC